MPNIIKPKNLIPKPGNESESVGFRLRVIRNSMGMSQKEFADFLGTYQVRISSIEKGTAQPTFSILQKLSAMGYDMSWLLNGIPSENVTDYVSSNIEIIKIVSVLEKLDINQVKFISNFIDLYTNSLKGGNTNEQNS